MLPPADQKGALIQRITHPHAVESSGQPESAGSSTAQQPLRLAPRRLYDCKCANDCFCSPRREVRVPTSRRPGMSPHTESNR